MVHRKHTCDFTQYDLILFNSMHFKPLYEAVLFSMFSFNSFGSGYEIGKKSILKGKSISTSSSIFLSIRFFSMQ